MMLMIKKINAKKKQGFIGYTVQNGTPSQKNFINSVIQIVIENANEV